MNLLIEGEMPRTVGELRKLLEGLPDDTPVRHDDIISARQQMICGVGEVLAGAEGITLGDFCDEHHLSDDINEAVTRAVDFQVFGQECDEEYETWLDQNRDNEERLRLIEEFTAEWRSQELCDFFG